MPIAPADYPPPFAASEVVAAPEAPADEQLEVGVAIVGGGPAGLACAVRLAQLLEADPALGESLGEVPIALVDKGRAVGAHQLSGAVVQPAPLLELFPGIPLSEMTSYGPVEREAVYLLTPLARRAAAARAAADAQQGQPRLLAGAARALHGRAGRGARRDGAARDRRPAAARGRRRRARRAHRRQGARPPGRGAADVRARRRADRARHGARRRRAGDALRRGRRALRPAAREPADLRARGQGGVARRAPARAASCTRSAGRSSRQARFREFGGTFAYPMGPDMLCLGLVVGLDYADASLSVHDLLQEVKLHPLFRKMLEGGERVAWGAKAIPEGGFWSLPASVSPPGARAARRRRRVRQRPAPEGRPLRAAQRHPGRRDDLPGARRTAPTSRSPARSRCYDAQVRNSEIYHDLHRYRNMRQAFRHGLIVGGAWGGAMDTLRGDLPPWRLATHPDAEQPMFDGGAHVRRARRQADVRQALVGLRERQPQPRRPARPPAHPAPRAARARHRLGQPLPGAGLRGRRRRARTASSSSR